jgi:hypothetical protein
VSVSEIVFSTISGLFALIFFFVRQTIVDMKADIHESRQDLQNVKLNYLHRDDFRDFKDELRGWFSELKQDLKDFKRDQENGRS